MSLAKAPRLSSPHYGSKPRLPRSNNHPQVMCLAVSQKPDVSLERRYEFETRAAKKCLQFQNATVDGKNVIIVSAVRGPCYEAGIQPGDQLTGISDTNRDEVWELDEMASLRFVYMSMNMRIPQTITLTTRKNPPEWVEAALAGSTDTEQPAAETAAPKSGGNQKYLDEVLQSMSSDDEGPVPTASSSVDMSPTSPVSEAERQLLLRVEQRQMEKSRSQERIKNRKNYMEQVGQRNDAPFIATVFAFFFLPAAVILVIAFGTGYIDSLSGMYRP